MSVALHWGIFLVGLAVFWRIRLKLMAHFWAKVHTRHQIALFFSVSISLTLLMVFLLGLGALQEPIYLAEHLDLVEFGIGISLLHLVIGYPAAYFLSHTIVFTREYSERFRPSGAPLQRRGVNRVVSDIQN